MKEELNLDSSLLKEKIETADVRRPSGSDSQHTAESEECNDLEKSYASLVAREKRDTLIRASEIKRKAHQHILKMVPYLLWITFAVFISALACNWFLVSMADGGEFESDR